MLYSPTITAIMGLSGAHDSALLQMAKVKDPITKANLERQEARIMSCFLELLGSLSEEDQKQVLALVKVTP
ncbi:hypothetical protein SG34_032100 [Thalassomonas viridans]|uniref:Uncharacterized protein n=1 Tax=Thalassomonas viridans TaxID=137584 RepID=A0AAE9ZDC7_9GAMM|nr:hypothetical protein [Thalassomonas viridans]WDE08567.1 hypothetical protein SG34_032100 [Thalassomonas viridans]